MDAFYVFLGTWYVYPALAVVCAVVIGLAILIFAKNPLDLRKNPARTGMWFYGGVVLWLAVSVLYTIIYATQVPGVMQPMSILMMSGSATVEKFDFVCRLFLAFREQGSLIGVALGFASLAWVQFFNQAKESSSQPSDIGEALLSAAKALAEAQQAADNFKKVADQTAKTAKEASDKLGV